MAKYDLPPLSPTETEILRLVWQLDHATVQDACENLPKRRRMSYATVQTLLRRLEKKGYLKHRVRGNAYVYYSAVNRESVLKRTVNDFVQRAFGGDPIPLMIHLAKHGRLSVDDVKRLMTLIEEE